MKHTKKLVAFIALFTIVVSTIAHAANAPLDGATAGVTLSGSAATEVLTVTQPGKDFTGDKVKLYVIKKNDDTVAHSNSGTTIATNANGSFTITMDFDTKLNTTTRYTIAFQTVSGDFGWAVLVINTDNTLTVTGTVLPVLKFALEATSKDFGVLTATYTGVTTGIEVGTNAVNGVTVKAKTTNGWLKSTTASHTINLSGNNALYAAEGYQFKSDLGTHDSTASTGITWVALTTMNTVNKEITVYTAPKPQNFDTAWDYDADFTAQAKISASTPAASDYKDTIIFTATGNF
jgi:hypothetical protein